MLHFVTILTLLAPIPVAIVVYGLCVRALHARARPRLADAVAADRHGRAEARARGDGVPAVSDASKVA
jgi:hypothetical protein